MHGGLSPDIRSIDQIRLIEREQEIPHEGIYCDMVWSDPSESIPHWGMSPRGAFLFQNSMTEFSTNLMMNIYMYDLSSSGAGYIFGQSVTSEFNHLNGLELICRAHQLVNEGFKYMFAEKNLITVWSAPNYCYRCGNVAAILAFDENLEREFRMFRDTPEPTSDAASGGEYFL